MLNSDNVVEVVLSQCYVITMKYVDDNTCYVRGTEYQMHTQLEPQFKSIRFRVYEQLLEHIIT